MRISKTRLIGAGTLAIVLVFLYLANIEQTGRLPSVPAGYLYSGEYVDVHAPNSEGWHFTETSTTGLAFRKDGMGPDDSIIAAVNTFKLSQTSSDEEFVSLIRAGVENDTPEERFDVLASNFEYVGDRGYPCVEVSFLGNDKQAQVSKNQQEVQLLEIAALYCRHPEFEETGFSVTYSHRGKTRYPNLEIEAKDFIDGTQVSER